MHLLKKIITVKVRSWELRGRLGFICWECEYTHYILGIGTHFARDFGFRKPIRSSSQAATAIATRTMFSAGAPPSEPPVYQARVGAVVRLSSKYSLGFKSNGLRCQHYQQLAWTARVLVDGEGTDAKGSNPNQCNLIWFEFGSVRFIKAKTQSENSFIIFNETQL